MLHPPSANIASVSSMQLKDTNKLKSKTANITRGAAAMFFNECRENDFAMSTNILLSLLFTEGHNDDL